VFHLALLDETSQKLKNLYENINMFEKMSLKVYLISQTVNHDYDSYSDAVVIAENEEVAKRIHPRGHINYSWSDKDNEWQYKYNRDLSAEDEWTTPKDITCILVAEVVSPTYTAGQVVCASYHAG